MRRRVVVTDLAQSDLADIYQGIATDSPQAAERIFNQIDDAIMALAEGALRNPLVGTFPNPSIRRRVVGSYNVFYRIVETTVIVDRILHGARNATHILFPED